MKLLFGSEIDPKSFCKKVFFGFFFKARSAVIRMTATVAAPGVVEIISLAHK